jgi:hypothetical protein
MKGNSMKTLLFLTLLLAMAPAGNCRNAPWPAKAGLEKDFNEKLTIYFGRGGCPFKCPVFTITIRPDRSVEYEGIENTRVLGKRTYTLSTEAHDAILNAVKRARVEQLAGQYKSVPGRDSGTLILRVSWGGKTKEIIHFLPSPEAPQELGDLEDAIVKNAYPSEGGAS